MIFDTLILLSCIFFALSVFSLAFVAGYAVGTKGRVQKREKNKGWENILNYNHRREEEDR